MGTESLLFFGKAVEVLSLRERVELMAELDLEFSIKLIFQ